MLFTYLSFVCAGVNFLRKKVNSSSEEFYDVMIGTIKIKREKFDKLQNSDLPDGPDEEKDPLLLRIAKNIKDTKTFKVFVNNKKFELNQANLNMVIATLLSDKEITKKLISNDIKSIKPFKHKIFEQKREDSTKDTYFIILKQSLNNKKFKRVDFIMECNKTFFNTMVIAFLPNLVKILFFQEEVWQAEASLV